MHTSMGIMSHLHAPSLPLFEDRLFSLVSCRHERHGPCQREGVTRTHAYAAELPLQSARAAKARRVAAGREGTWQVLALTSFHRGNDAGIEPHHRHRVSPELRSRL